MLSSLQLDPRTLPHRLRVDLPPDQADADLAYLKAVSTGAATAGPTAAAAPARSWASVKGPGG